ncbi:hypothetical protein [Geobacter sp. DSM 9736]|uniref:hypothetical protein n=1 Tax=Geobacter sp. DSM 9736 TaxID=1277350 RepID=UPI000B50E921|nr:hypothetical protein [Geobacter sp. DSM 9736]SNB46730.1 hypothetical protein SAMN06269301_2200 [Geobacter sp. DSM 9736]
MNGLTLVALLAAFAALDIAPAHAEEPPKLTVSDQVNFSLDQTFYTQSVSGNRDMSSLDTGGQYLSLIDFSGRKYLSDGALLELSSNIRGASDPQISPRHRDEPEILRIVGRYVKPHVLDVSIGDIYPRYNSYALIRSLEGGTATLWFLDRPNHGGLLNTVSANATLARVHRHEDSSRFNRYAGALRAEAGAHGKWNLAASAVHTWDDRGSNGNLQLAAIDNWVGSLHHIVNDVSVGRFRYMTLENELAWSWHEEGSRSSAETGKTDYAWKSNIAGRFMAARWGLSYEQVGPDFVSSVGAAPADQALFNASTRVPVTRWLNTNATYSHYHNNLDGRLSATTRTQSPAITLDFHSLPVKFLPIPEWHNLSFLVGFNARDTETSDEATDWQRYIWSLGGNYRLRNMNMGLTQAFTIHDDDTAANADYRESATTALLGVRDIPVAAWLRSSVNLTASYTGQTFGGKTDDYWVYGLGLSGAVWKRNTFIIAYNLRDINKTTVDSANYTANLFRSEWTYQLLKGTTGSLRYTLRDNQYSQVVRNYREDLLELNFRMIF